MRMNVKDQKGNDVQTSMHSSGMRTSRLLAVSPSMHCSGGALLQGGVCSGGVSAPGDVCSGAVSARGDGDLLQLGGGEGGLVSQHALRQTPPVNRMTDRQV